MAATSASNSFVSPSTPSTSYPQKSLHRSSLSLPWCPHRRALKGGIFFSPSPPTPIVIGSRTNSSNPRYPSLAIDPLPPFSKDKGDGGGGVGDGRRLAPGDGVYGKDKYFNVQIVVGENEPEESVLRRFKREVAKAGVMKECRRRRWFENKQEKRKRKKRDAAQRNRRGRSWKKYNPQDKQQETKREDKEEEDNWELPEGELPY